MCFQFPAAFLVANNQRLPPMRISSRQSAPPFAAHHRMCCLFCQQRRSFCPQPSVRRRCLPHPQHPDALTASPSLIARWYCGRDGVQTVSATACCVNHRKLALCELQKVRDQMMRGTTQTCVVQSCQKFRARCANGSEHEITANHNTDSSELWSVNTRSQLEKACRTCTNGLASLAWRSACCSPPPLHPVAAGFTSG